MGFGGRVQVPVFQTHPETTVRSICSGTLARAERTATEFGIEHFTSDYRESVARDDVDVVSIVTPPHLHAPIVLEALRNGKHVLCEKPFAMDAGEARKMVIAAKRARRAGMIDHEFRYIPARSRLKELVDDGWLGALERIAVVEASTWMAKGSTLRHGWQSRKSSGGGILGAIGSHFIDFCRWIAGDIREVSATLQTVVKQRPREDGSLAAVDADDNCSVRLRLWRDVLASIELCATTNAQLTNIAVFGSNGALCIRGNELFGLRAGRDPVPVTASLKPPAKAFGGGHPLMGPFYVLVGEMARKIRGEPSSVPTFEDGMRVQEALDAARSSSRTGRTVRLRRKRGRS